MRVRKKLLALTIGSATLLLFTVSGIITAADVPEEIVIENSGYAKDRYGPSNFHHKKHNEEYKIGCTECHHVYKDGENVWKECDPVQKCTECHNPEKKKGSKDIDLEDAYHDNCRTCHREMVKAGKMDKKMKSCNFCHKRKK